MKQIFPILLFIFTISTFGQENEYNTAQNLYLAKNYKESLEYTEKLLNNDFGEINDYVKVYVLSMNANSHYQLKNYKLAFDRYDEYLNFIKTTPLKLFSKSDKKKLVNEITKLLEDIKQSYPLALSESNPASDNTTSSSLTDNSNLSSNNSDQTVTILVSGSGKTQDEAKQNALRSAIEQAFGAFISSETIINNDSFVSDNITSLSQGSVISFNILSSNILPDKNVTLTISAKVSISQMQKITESKGYTATIAGGLFGLNLKLFKLQAVAEERVILDMARKSLKILENSIDFKLEVIPPKKSDLRIVLQNTKFEGRYSDFWKNTDQLSFNEIYMIRLIVECQPNTNLDVFIDYFISTLAAVKMSESEIDFAKQSGSEYYKLINFSSKSEESYFYLRNFESVRIISSLFERSTLNLVNYDIVSNDNLLNYTPFYKKGIDEEVSKHYAMLKKLTENIQILDSNHYVFPHGLLPERDFNNGRSLMTNYPSDFYGEGDSDYRFYLLKTDSDFSGFYYNGDVIYHRTFKGTYGEYKITPAKNNTNLRYQIFDYYLPLSDVEKLDSIKIIKHNSLSDAR
ncbi:MAG: hypothetical protein Q8S41_02205 [Lutibacter sp.]|nr:hypothetical protein [Lutibacter sp.]